MKTWPELIADELEKRRIDLPTPTTRAERRRWQADDERDAARQIARTERRNVPPRPVDAESDCPDSKYRRHRFSARGADGVLRCAFCGAPFAQDKDHP